MSTNADLFHAISDALIVAHGQNATEWIEGGGPAAIGRGVAGWHAEIAQDAWLDLSEDVLSLRALRHIEHVVELAGGAPIKARIGALVDEVWNGRRHGAKARIGEVFAHELLVGRHGRTVRIHRVRVSRARRGSTGRGRRAAVERGASPLRRRGPRRSVPRRGEIRRAPGPVPRPTGTGAPGEGDVSEGRMAAGLPRTLVEQLRQPLRPRRFARRMQVLRGIEQRVPR